MLCELLLTTVCRFHASDEYICVSMKLSMAWLNHVEMMYG